MKTLLITGASGFVGSHTLPYLKENYTIHAVSRQAETLDKNITWHNIDLLDTVAMQELIKTVRPTHLLHFAWYVVHGLYWHSPLNYQWVQATLGLLQTFQQQGGQ